MAMHPHHFVAPPRPPPAMASSLLQVSLSPRAPPRPIAHPPQDSMPDPTPDTLSSSRFRPYACAAHTVSRTRYITSCDPRGYLCVYPPHPAPATLTLPSPVYEYLLNGQSLMVDCDTGYVLWTGIWKGQCAVVTRVVPPRRLTSPRAALGNTKGSHPLPRRCAPNRAR